MPTDPDELPEPDFDSESDLESQDLPDPAAAPGHVPVLPAEVLEYLTPKPGQIFLDCTLGRAGHAALVIPHLVPGGRYIGLDVDPGNIQNAEKALSGSPIQVDLVHANFASATSVLAMLGITKVDMLLADLGFASTQMSDPARGFSFRNDGPLDMRLDPNLATTAGDIVNTWPERELADLIYRYGEERLSRKIARKIVEERSKSPMKTTSGLAALVRHAYGPAAGRSRIDPATRTFMALRIAVNEELAALERLLHDIPNLMATHGRAAIISFHSLEDRMVKRSFLGYQQADLASRLTTKPVIAGDSERNTNPRSRSAKMRVVQWTPREKYKRDQSTSN